MAGNCTYDSAQGRFLSQPLATTDEHYLIVRSDGMRTVYQKLVITSVPGTAFGFTVGYADAEILVVENALTKKKTTQWIDSCCKDVTFAGLKQSGGISLASLVIKIVMSPFSQVVVLCGVHYHGAGSPWRSYFQTRWQELVGETWSGQRKVIDPGTLVVFFSCEEQSLFLYVKSRNGAYLSVRTDVKPDRLTGFVPGQTYPPCLPGGTVTARNSYSIVEMYDHVAAAPSKSIREVSIFSHSWGKGPILYDTNEGAGYWNNPDKRDPNDFDGRIKDFKSNTLYGGWPVTNAMADSGRWRIWGCSNDPWMRAAMIAANGLRSGGSRSTFANGPFTHWDNSHVSIPGEHHTTLDICYAQTLDGMLGSGYAGALAARLKTNATLHAWSAVPGSWAMYNGRTFWVDWPQTPETLVYFQNEPNINTYFKRDSKGYVDFVPYQKLSAPSTPAGITEHHILETANTPPHYFKTVFYDASPYGLRFFKVVNCTPPTTWSAQAIADAGATYGNSAYAGRSGHVHIIRDKAGQEWRFLVMTSGTNAVEVKQLSQGSGGAWTIPP
jgi:hypothetical protein